MLLTTGFIALSRKVNDERAKKKEAKQGRLNVGSSDVARDAFQSQLSQAPSNNRRLIELRQNGVQRSPTEIKYEDPTDITALSPSTESPTSVYSPIPAIQETHCTSRSQINVASPVESEKGHLSIASPSETISTGSALNSVDGARASTDRPPSYTEQSPSSTRSPTSDYSSTLRSSIDMHSKPSANSDVQSISTTSSYSSSSQSLRVKTKGNSLDSGFPYHPALFDLQVHPEKWDAFTTQVIDTTKFSGRDRAQILAASAGTAMTGAFVTSIWLGRKMTRERREKKVKAGLSDMSDGGLGDTLQQWNDDYFNQRGLYVHLELSESAMKNANQKSKSFQKNTLLYSDRDDRERKREERKYVIVVTKLDENGEPSEAAKHLTSAMDEENIPTIPELDAGDDVPVTVVEMPGNEHRDAVELPAMELPAGYSLGYSSENKLQPPQGYAELDGGLNQSLEKSSV